MKKIILSMLLLGFSSLFAQEDLLKKLKISGSVDTYYQTYLTAPENLEQSFGTSFANQKGFALGMANLVLKYDGEKTGVVADLVFGPRGDAAAGGYNLNQLYVYWKVSEKTKLTMGRFNTYVGYEVISPVSNFHYSTSYLFSNGPFSMLGLKADFFVSEDLSLMLAVMNETDKNNNITGNYSLGGQLGYKKQFLNLYYANTGLGLEIDYTGGLDLTNKLYLGLNAAYTNDKNGSGFHGIALYPKYATSDKFSLGLRGEYFERHEKGVSNIPSVIATTLTGSYTVENLVIKPEIRLDSWDKAKPYFDSKGAVSSSLAAFTVAAIYSF